MANIGELPYQVLGTAPKFGLREEIVKKIALHVENLSLFIYLLGSFPLTFSLPLLSLLPGFNDVHKRLGI